MILLVGATGYLGRNIASQLLAKGHRVRAMTRDLTRATSLATAGAEIVRGDVRDMESLRAATRGVRAVVSASHSMMGSGKSSVARVDDEGQHSLIAAAKEAGVEHFVFLSASGASPNHPVDFWRTKEKNERHLEASGLPYTIVRPGAFMELHSYELIGKAVAKDKRVVLFGPGSNLRNFVAEADVARLVVLALEDVRLRGETIEIGGPENLSGLQVVAIFERLTGKRARVTHLPLAALRLFSRLLSPVHEGVGRVLKAGVVGETTDQTLDPAPLLARYPIKLTRLEDWARDCLARHGAESHPLQQAAEA